MPINTGPTGASSRHRFAVARRSDLSVAVTQRAEDLSSPGPTLPADRPGPNPAGAESARRGSPVATARMLTVRTDRPGRPAGPAGTLAGGPQPGAPARAAPKWGWSTIPEPRPIGRPVGQSVGIAAYKQVPDCSPSGLQAGRTALCHPPTAPPSPNLRTGHTATKGESRPERRRLPRQPATMTLRPHDPEAPTTRRPGNPAEEKGQSGHPPKPDPRHHSRPPVSPPSSIAPADQRRHNYQLRPGRQTRATAADQQRSPRPRRCTRGFEGSAGRRDQHREAPARPLQRRSTMQNSRWAYVVSNHGPLPCEGSALPLSYTPLPMAPRQLAPVHMTPLQAMELPYTAPTAACRGALRTDTAMSAVPPMSIVPPLSTPASGGRPESASCQLHRDWPRLRTTRTGKAQGATATADRPRHSGDLRTSRTVATHRDDGWPAIC